MKKGGMQFTAEQLVTILAIVLIGMGFFLMIWRVFNASAKTS